MGKIVRLILLFGLTTDICVAATNTATFGVSAMVNATCTVVANLLDFGNYNPLSGSALTATTTVSATCTNGTPYTLSLNAGNTGNFTNRLLVNGGNNLNYNLYTSSAYTTVWGDGTGGTATNAGTGNGTAQPYTAYGRIPSGQNVPASVTSYSDLITVTVTY